MSRKTTKSILSRDEVCLLLYSEEPKNTEVYGNLYEVLLTIKDLKAITSDELQNLKLNKTGLAALTYNKESLMDSVKREWYVESQSAEDPDKKVRCGLCNTPNKYLFYIKNRINYKQVNVGSFCMTKFPGIDGYAEHKSELSHIVQNQKQATRKTEFYSKIPNVSDILDASSFYFDNLPILLPANIYFPLQDSVKNLRLIFTKYIKYGSKPFESELNSFELFSKYTKAFNSFKEKADKFISENLYDPCICKRPEIDWIIKNKNKKLLNDIIENNGFYVYNTLIKITSPDFIRINFKIFIERNISESCKLLPMKENKLPIYFVAYYKNFTFKYIFNTKKFMKNIGANCILYDNFTYGDAEIFSSSTIVISYNNLQKASRVLEESLLRLNYVILIDETTDCLYL